jgi:hypothetical protein
MTTLFEAADAKALRDAALARVSTHAGNWSRAARLKVRSLPAGWEGTGEDIRVWLANTGFPEPHHHNAWGATINTCVKHDWLEWTGRIVSMRTRRSHARSTKVYRRTHKP